MHSYCRNLSGRGLGIGKVMCSALILLGSGVNAAGRVYILSFYYYYYRNKEMLYICYICYYTN